MREHTIRTDPAQITLPGAEPSALQAQAARDAEGRGGLVARVPQRRCDIGLFEFRPDQPSLPF